jgi:hypothetical protein
MVAQSGGWQGFLDSVALPGAVLNSQREIQVAVPAELLFTLTLCTLSNNMRLYTGNIYCSSAYTILVECPEIYEWVWPFRDQTTNVVIKFTPFSTYSES